MKNTSSSSVDGTTEGSRPDQTGRQPIEKSNAPTSPGKRMSNLEYRLWYLRGWLRHQIGTHTLVAREVWDRNAEGQFVITYNGDVCWFCEYSE